MSEERTSVNIEIQGVRKTVAALKAFTPEIHKALNDNIKSALRDTQDTAKSIYPRGAWTVGVSQKKLLGYVAARGGGSRAQVWGDSSPGVRASIFEFAGTRSSSSRPQVVNMIASLNRRYGTPGRFLWEAWDRSGSGVLLDIRLSVQKAERELQAALDAAGEDY